jgi:hypothetical protein
VGGVTNVNKTCSPASSTATGCLSHGTVAIRKLSDSVHGVARSKCLGLTNVYNEAYENRTAACKHRKDKKEIN